VLADTVSLCGKAAVLGDKIKEIPCIVEGYSCKGSVKTDYLIQTWEHLNKKQGCQPVDYISRCLIILEV
jgi:hypothetical protein